MKDEFEQLDVIYTAIKDIDRICNEKEVPDLVKQPSGALGDNKLDRILFAVKDIDKAKYKETLTNTIITSIREALVLIYQEEFVNLNSLINLDTQITANSSPVTVTESEGDNNVGRDE